MENEKYINLGKHFYSWYRSGKVSITINNSSKGLENEIKRVADLIDYVEEKKRLKS